MNKLLLNAVLAGFLALPALPVLAAGDHGGHQNSATPAATNTASDMTEGEVRKVDKESSKVTIKHGEIKNLDMPAMTMVFQVKDPAMLDKVKAGDKVRFKAEKAGSTFTVTDVQAAQ